MKKKIVAVLSLVLICQISVAQKNVDQLFREFAKVENSSVINIGGVTMSLAGMFTDTMGVDGIEVFGFDSCTDEVKEQFSKAIRELKDSKYETMVTSNDSGSRTKVLVKLEDDVIKEMVVLTSGSSNALVRIKGNIKPEDIDRVVNQHTNK